MTCTEQSFLADVAQYKMTILHDDGVYRHLEFKAPGTFRKYFELVTWPGHLCCTGNMGSFVFRRSGDMFEFVREDRGHAQGLYIDRRYWAAHLASIGKYDGVQEFDPDAFCSAIRKTRKEWMRCGGLNKGERRGLWEAVRDRVLSAAEDGEAAALRAFYDFFHRVGDVTFFFLDNRDYNFKKYTYEFDWCYYALAWGVKQYDLSVAPSRRLSAPASL